MTCMATDVVLLPDEEMTGRVIEINRQIVREYSAEIVLSRDGRLPHLSLAMGCIERQDIYRIGVVLAQIASQTEIRRLTAVGIQTSTNSRGLITAVLEIENTAELQALHERIMGEMGPFFRPDVTDAVFYDDSVSESTLDWVRNYRQKAAYQQFNPHITLGYGKPAPGLAFPMTFMVSRLALCHLGNHGTCCRILTAVDL